MTKLDKPIAQEADASEANRDAPVGDNANITHPNRARSTVYSVRLNPDEVAAVQALADAAHLPASTLVRSWIIDKVRSEQGDMTDAETELRAAQRHLTHLQRHLTQTS